MLILLFSASVMWGNHIESYDPEGDLKTLPLPPIKIVHPMNASPPSNMSQFKLTEEDIRLDGFHFPGLDAQLGQQSQNMLMTPPPEEDKMNDLLVELGNGDYSSKIREARQVLEKAINAGKFISTLTGGDLVKLPLVLKKQVGNITVHVVFNSVKLLPEYAELEVFAGVTIPQKTYDENGVKKDMTLMFAASGIKFSQEGGIIGGATLGLLDDVAFQLGGSSKKMAVVLNGWNQSNLNPNNEPLNYGTFITIDCDGFKEFGISADVHFTREWMLPTDEDGELLPGETRVKGHFELYVQDWNNLVVENLGIDHFTLTKFQDLSFYVGNANIDLSDYRNPGSLVFPEGHPSPPAGQENLWRGVYIETIEITLPTPFKQRCDSYGHLELDQTDFMIDEAFVSNDREFSYFDWSNDGMKNSGPDPGGYEPYSKPVEEVISWTAAEKCRIKIGAENLLIDKNGVSGKFYVEGEAPIISGSLIDDSWGYSLDHVSITLVASSVEGFGFGGEIAVPIMDKSTPIGYIGEMEWLGDGNFDFFLTATLGEDLAFPMWNAVNVVLKQGSSVTLGTEKEDNKPINFFASANLSGELTIGKPEDYQNDPSGSKVKVPKLVFEQLLLNTKAPYIDLGPTGFVEIEGGTGDAKLMNFPFQLNYFAFKKYGEAKVSLEMDISLNFMDPADGGISGGGGFKLVGKLEQDVNGGHHWVYDKMELTGIHVELDFPMFTASGVINIFTEDPTYGNGFSGKLSAEIMGGGGASAFNLEMAAIFGSKNAYRYFLVDAFVGSDKISIPLPPTPIELRGFGGGVFHHMKPTAYHDPDSGPPLNQGVDASGIVYEPTPMTKLGLKFAVAFSTTANTMKGKLTCIIRFTQSMSLQNVTFWGVADFINGAEAGSMKEVPDMSDRVKSVSGDETTMHNEDADNARKSEDKMSAKLGLSLDFEHGFSFHGYAEVFLNYTTINLTGTGSLDLLIDPAHDKWHLYIGGYSDGSVERLDFFDPYPNGPNGAPNTAPMVPLGVTIKYSDDLTVAADVYFLMGNDLPGPPPMHPQAAEFFEEPVSNNRGTLNCNGRSPAMGTGIAFGAAAFFTVEKTVKKFPPGCIRDVKVKAYGGVGFDISLLSYGKGTTCPNPDAEPNGDTQGIKGFRMTGRIWAFVDIKGKHVTCIPIPRIGAGLKLEADVINPSYFDVTVVVRFIKKIKFKLEIGDKCGVPCDDGPPGGI